MIRFAVHDDLPELIELGCSLFDQTAWSEHVEFDAGSFQESLFVLIEGRCLLVAVSNGGDLVGMLGFVVAPIYANGAYCFAQELFVIARSDSPGAGRLLMEAFEQEARARGAIVAMVSAQIGLRDRALGRVFRRLGYSETERTFMKGL